MASRYTSARTPFGIIDLGSSRLACLIAVAGNDGTPVLLGQSIHAAEGIRQGEITDMARFSTTLGKAVEAAEKNAGVTINTLHIVTSAGTPHLVNQLAEITLFDKKISRRDLTKLAQKQAELPQTDGYMVCQRQASEYLIDGLGQIDNPIGMTGKRLGLAFNELLISEASHANFLAAIEQNHLNSGLLYHSAAAAGLSCLSEDERELGTLLIDFGGGTTALTIYSEGKLRHLSTVRMGGQNITRDIAKMLSISTAEAERLKAIDGSVMPNMAQTALSGARAFPSRGDNFVLSGPLAEQDLITLGTGQVIERAFLNDIIRTRLEEILESIDQQLAKTGMQPASSYHLAITGGASQLTGLADFVSHYWGKPASIKMPSARSGYDNQISGGSFAASIGMVIFVQNFQNNQTDEPAKRLSRNNMFGRLRDWFRQNL